MNKTVEELRKEVTDILDSIEKVSLTGVSLPKNLYRDKILSIFLDQTRNDCPECGGNKTMKYGGTVPHYCFACNGTGKVGEWHPESLVVLHKGINPYPETLVDEATGQVFEDDRHKAWDEGHLYRGKNE